MLPSHVRQYRVLRKVGQGGMGVVYEAVHKELPIRVAIKVLFTAFAQDDVRTERLVSEARTISQLHHSSLVKVTDFGRLDDGTAYMVMEYLDGETLRQRMARTRLDTGTVLSIGAQVASALAQVHQAGIVHRDLTPANIMLISDPETSSGERAKILDFGIAKFLAEPSPVTQSGLLLGTPRYMSPEQCSGEPLDGRSDVYALGVILFEALSGRWPYSCMSNERELVMHCHMEQKPRALREGCPDAESALVALINRMLAKDPAQRPGVKEIEATLGACMQRLGPVPPPNLLPAPVPSVVTETGQGNLQERAEALRPAPALTRRQLWRAIGTAVLATLGAASLIAVLRSFRPRLNEPSVQLAGMVLLQGGRFEMGSTPAEVEAALLQCQAEIHTGCPRDIYEREQPRHEVTLSPFFMEVTEVTNARYTRWLNSRKISYKIEEQDGGVYVVDTATNARLIETDPSFAPIFLEKDRFVVKAQSEGNPVVRVSWWGAKRFCETQGMRLPTEAEWEYAARGGTTRTYPWGNSPPRCDGVAFGHAENTACKPIWEVPHATTSYEQDRSPQGIHDLGGSVSEWVEDEFSRTHPSCGPCKDWVYLKTGPADKLVPTRIRVFRGGSYWMPAADARAAVRSGLPEGEVRGNIGFRCAYSPGR